MKQTLLIVALVISLGCKGQKIQFSSYKHSMGDNILRTWVTDSIRYVEIEGDTMKVIKMMCDNWEKLQAQNFAMYEILSYINVNGYVLPKNKKKFDAAVKAYKKLTP